MLILLIVLQNNTMKLKCPAWTALSDAHPAAYVPSRSSLQFQIKHKDRLNHITTTFALKASKDLFLLYCVASWTIFYLYFWIVMPTVIKSAMLVYLSNQAWKV